MWLEVKVKLPYVTSAVSISAWDKEIDYHWHWWHPVYLICFFMLLFCYFLVVSSRQRCAHALLRFRHKNHSVRVRKTLWFGCEYLLRHHAHGWRWSDLFAGFAWHKNPTWDVSSCPWKYPVVSCFAALLACNNATYFTVSCQCWVSYFQNILPITSYLHFKVINYNIAVCLEQ